MKRMLSFVVVATLGFASFVTAQTEPPAEEMEMVKRVISLMDHPLSPGLTISIVDFRKISRGYPKEIREKINRSSAFVIGSDPDVIYIDSKGEHFLLAMEGSDFSSYVLAAILEHETKHTQGFTECEAYDRQLKVWEIYMGRGVVTGKPSMDHAKFFETTRNRFCNAERSGR